MRERQPSLGLLILALMAACLGIWLWPSATARHTESTTRSLEPPVSAGVGGNQPDVPSSAAASPALSERAERGTRTQLSAQALERRQQVLAAVRERRRDPTSAPGAPAGGDETGELGAQVHALDERLVPLAAACHERALERDPRLGGRLVMHVRFASAAGIGGVIESVEPGPGNEMTDAQVLECVRQAAFGIELPAPSTDVDSERYVSVALAPRETAQAAGEPPRR